jgi:hypothetical protein
VCAMAAVTGTRVTAKDISGSKLPVLQPITPLNTHASRDLATGHAQSPSGSPYLTICTVTGTHTHSLTLSLSNTAHQTLKKFYQGRGRARGPSGNVTEPTTFPP